MFVRNQIVMLARPVDVLAFLPGSERFYIHLTRCTKLKVLTGAARTPDVEVISGPFLGCRFLVQDPEIFDGLSPLEQLALEAM